MGPWNSMPCSPASPNAIRKPLPSFIGLTSAKLHGVIARIVTRGDASGEILQEAFVRIWERAADFDPAKGSAIAWMATIARNRALDEVRKVRPESLEDMPDGFRAGGRGGRSAGRRASERATDGAVAVAWMRWTKRNATPCCSPIIAASSREALARRYDKPVPTIKTWLRRSLAPAQGLSGIMSRRPGRRSPRSRICARCARSRGARDAGRAPAARARTRRRRSPLGSGGCAARGEPRPRFAPERDFLPDIEARIAPRRRPIADRPRSVRHCGSGSPAGAPRRSPPRSSPRSCLPAPSAGK